MHDSLRRRPERINGPREKEPRPWPRLLGSKEGKIEYVATPSLYQPPRPPSGGHAGDRHTPLPLASRRSYGTPSIAVASLESLSRNLEPSTTSLSRAYLLSPGFGG